MKRRITILAFAGFALLALSLGVYRQISRPDPFLLKVNEIKEGMRSSEVHAILGDPQPGNTVVIVPHEPNGFSKYGAGAYLPIWTYSDETAYRKISVHVIFAPETTDGYKVALTETKVIENPTSGWHRVWSRIANLLSALVK